MKEKKNLLKLRHIALLFAVLLAATSCSTENLPNSDPSEQTHRNVQQDAQQDDSGEVDVSDEAPRGELLFQDERVSIYSEDNKLYTVNLVYGEYTQRLEDFNSLLPVCTTWEADADGDGTNELYLIHTFGSGTGVSVQKLFVFEPNGDSLDIYYHDSKDIQAQFNASCSGVHDPGQRTLQLSYGGDSYLCLLDGSVYATFLPEAAKTVLISGRHIQYAPTEDNTVQLSFLLSFQAEGVDPSLSYLPEDTAVSCLIRFNGTGFELIEDLEFIHASERPWMASEFDTATPLGYEEFFAQERSYSTSSALSYNSRAYSTWYAGESESRARYGLRSDEDGLFVYKDSHWYTPYYRIPNTEDLNGCSALLTSPCELICMMDGKLLRVDMLSGKRDTLYTTEYIPDMVVCNNAVLYFLALSDGILSLNRLYLPTMTLDMLYAQTAPEVPVSCYELYVPGSSQSVITWETINPIFWKAIEEIMAGPESEYPDLYYLRYFTVDYITAHSLHDEAVQHNFSLLQDVTGLRPRMKCSYDPMADTYDERYGIYDICFFGTGIHGDSEHFADTPEYIR
ncbi:MAG: hypothetical protein IKM11_00965 [Oscillospiraceae bacterium]|nr:hypothetical protein [Oscillospiraceae bacterium]